VRDSRPGWQATQQGYTVAISPLELVSDEPTGPARPQPPPVPPTPPIMGTLANYDGFLAILASTYPTSSQGLPAGSLYAPSGPVQSYIYVVPGFSYIPGSPIFFGSVTAMQLSALGAFSLPQTDPQNNLQIWNNSGILNVSTGPSGSPLRDSSGNLVYDSAGNLLYGS
jgi:hypothetical protein